MRPKSDFIALGFTSDRDESSFLDELVSRYPNMNYSLVAPHTVIVEKDHRSTAEDICKQLRIRRPNESAVVDAQRLSAAELAEQRAARFRQRPDKETRDRLIRELENKKRA